MSNLPKRSQFKIYEKKKIQQQNVHRNFDLDEFIKEQKRLIRNILINEARTLDAIEHCLSILVSLKCLVDKLERKKI